MPSPFPGMDPYIEQPRIWPDFHNGLADEIRASLNATIRPRYFAALTPYVTYEVVEIAATRKEGIRPDLGVVRTGSPAAQAAAVTTFDPPHAESSTALEIPLELMSVEIRESGVETLVTTIEILSPVNKQRGHDAFTDYRRKRRELLRSAVHLMEIDLLRGGERPPLDEPVPYAPYYVTLSRANNRPTISVWALQLNERLPRLPVPLLEPDPDAVLDLAAVVAAVYERGGYDARIDYRQPVPPPTLNDREAAFIRELLHS